VDIKNSTNEKQLPVSPSQVKMFPPFNPPNQQFMPQQAYNPFKSSAY